MSTGENRTAALSRHEQLVLADFVDRRKVPVPIRLLTALLGLAGVLVAEVPTSVAAVTAALCGGLIGSWVETRHLHHLASAVAKLVKARETNEGM